MGLAEKKIRYTAMFEAIIVDWLKRSPISAAVEHRLFAFISKNSQGIPLANTALVVSLIGKTTASAGLTLTCVLDEPEYETGAKFFPW